MYSTLPPSWILAFDSKIFHAHCDPPKSWRTFESISISISISISFPLSSKKSLYLDVFVYNKYFAMGARVDRARHGYNTTRCGYNTTQDASHHVSHSAPARSPTTSLPPRSLASHAHARPGPERLHPREDGGVKHRVILRSGAALGRSFTFSPPLGGERFCNFFVNFS